MKCSLSSWLAAITAVALCAAPAAAQETGRNRGKLFDRLDKNGDGQLTREELPERARERLGRVFDRLGKDSLAKEDFAKLAQRRRGDAGRPSGDREGRAAKRSEAFFKRLDANGDGKVTQEEAPEQAKRLVERLLQRAGKQPGDSLSQEEFTKLVGQRHDREGGPGRGPRGAEGGPRRFPVPLLVQKLDADKDGQLSKDELSKAAEVFDELDSDKDGKLDPRELFGRGPGGPPFGRRRPGGRPDGDRRQRPGGGAFADRLFERFDTNKDGKLSQEEAPPRLKENFSRFDANSDGNVDRDELKQGFADRRGDRPDRRRPRQRRRSDP